MTNDKNKSLEGFGCARPIRLAFLIEINNPHAQLTLDAIFADCYARWGGRFSLIVPCVDGRILSDYWPWLTAFDPEILYSYVHLQDDEALRMHESLGPSDLIVHRRAGPSEPRARDFRPDYRFEPLSSVSTVFRLARHSPLAAGPRVRILDAWHTEEPSRFFMDNFGSYLGSRNTSVFPNDAKQAAGLATIVADEYYHDRKFGVPHDLDRLKDEHAALAEFSGCRATSMSLLSALYAPRLELQDWHWGAAFTVVVGDTSEDRLLFWNVRHFIPQWLDSDLCVLRVTLDQLRDPALLNAFVSMLNARNHVRGLNNGQPELRVRSASLSEADLAEAVKLLTQQRAWGLCGPGERVDGGHVIPDRKALVADKQSLFRRSGQLTGGEWAQFLWTPPLARPPVIEPEHVRDVPPRQSFTLGYWAVDFNLAFDGVNTHLGHGNRWLLPRRWRLARAFKLDYKQGPSMRLSLPPVQRTNREGNLTAISATHRTIEAIQAPDLRFALAEAFCAARHADAGDPPIPPSPARWIEPSNEDQHLNGVLGLAGGLPNAVAMLLHPFLRNAFAALGAAPNLAHTATASVTNKLLKQAKGRPQYDLTQQDDIDALAALVVKAAQSIRSPMTHLSLQKLKDDWGAYRTDWWEKNKQANTSRDHDDPYDAYYEEYEARSIDDALAKLRTQGMLFQGYPWRCKNCGHRNWTDFQALRATLNCDVCRSELPLPVEIPWYFKANGFLVESLRSHSTLSLLWVLAALHNRALLSFMFTGPTCFGWTDPDGAFDARPKPDAEADLLVLVDGESILCEVKSSWASVRAKDVEDLVALAIRLRPDRALLAVMEDEPRLKEQLEFAKKALAEVDIVFELLIPSDFSINDDPSVSIFD